MTRFLAPEADGLAIVAPIDLEAQKRLTHQCKWTGGPLLPSCPTEEEGRVLDVSVHSEPLKERENIPNCSRYAGGYLAGRVAERSKFTS
jgi:hypothetical protein